MERPAKFPHKFRVGCRVRSRRIEHAGHLSLFDRRQENAAKIRPVNPVNKLAAVPRCAA
jgi:hypothetical protein